MGIPGLTFHLKKSAFKRRLTCRNPHCDQSSGVVIDGPSLAYWIYNRLLKGFISNGEAHTRPSFELIRRMTLDFLELLESHNLNVLHVYFDGGLPVWKRATRFDRLHKDHLHRVLLRNQQADFKLTYSDQAPFAAEHLLDPGFDGHVSHVDLVTPFLVPLVIESLQNSKFSKRVEIVPGEADEWCAAFARKHSATILTNDSDLALFDLEKGQLVLLGSLKKHVCERCATLGIMANVIQPAKAAQMLSAENILHAAFGLLNTDQSRRELTHSTFTKKHPQKDHTSTVSATGFEEFRSRYSEVSLEDDVQLRISILNLDPRLAEITGQLNRSSNEDVISILPMLVEDPSRESAWAVSESIRVFTYSLLRHTSCEDDIVLVEHIEKGQSSRSDRAVSLLNKKLCIETCVRLVEFLQMVEVPYQDTGKGITYWRTVCSIHVCYYLLASGQLSSANMRPQLGTIWDGSRSGAGLSWPNIHFRGQLEATYYAFRQLHQILKYLELMGNLNNLQHASTLWQAIIDLPGIADMFENIEIETMLSVNSEYVIELAQEMLEV